MIRKKKKARTINIKEFKELKGLVDAILKNQNKIMKTVRTLTSFKPTSLKEIDGDNEDVKSREEGTGHYKTGKKRRKRRSKKLSLSEIKTFFHNRGYEIKDDGKRPIKVLNKKGKKIYVVQRDSRIYKRDRNHPKGYARIYVEDMV